MGNRFAELAFSPAVKAVQAERGSRGQYVRLEEGPASNERLTAAETDFLERRDSLYLASVGETGWPYVQHRGGPPGFIRVLDERTLGFADFRGNRQYVSVGNLRINDRVALILVDYPARRRLKLLGHAEIVGVERDPALIERLRPSGSRARIERGIVIRVAAFDWNCPQHITPRYTAAEVEELVMPLRSRIQALEDELRTVRTR
jgi:uncharacterized protein